MGDLGDSRRREAERAKPGQWTVTENRKNNVFRPSPSHSHEGGGGGGGRVILTWMCELDDDDRVFPVDMRIFQLLHLKVTFNQQNSKN